MHFVQYGVLSLLLQRAVAFRLPDASSYFVAALAGALVGCADEAVQWVVPGRYFGLRDIAINAFAASLVQVGLAMGIRPAGVARTTSRAGRRVALRIALALWAALLAFALNTPARVAVWAPRLPGLAFLATNESTMMEYGHRYDAPDIGVFRSRLAPEELAREDATRAAAGAALLDAYRDAYGDFLVDVPPRRSSRARTRRVPPPGPLSSTPTATPMATSSSTFRPSAIRSCTSCGSTCSVAIAISSSGGRRRAGRPSRWRSGASSRRSRRARIASFAASSRARSPRRAMRSRPTSPRVSRATSFPGWTTRAR